MAASSPENIEISTTISDVSIKIENLDTPAGLKICLVCGDKALGYNFNAISCESCKAFFRRNANTNKTFKCPFKNACEITTLTRKFCQKCRLKKCLAVGMVKEYIMSETDKAEKRRKIEENRARKRYNLKGEESPKKAKINSQVENNSDNDANIQYNILNSTTSPLHQRDSASMITPPLTNDIPQLPMKDLPHQTYGKIVQNDLHQLSNRPDTNQSYRSPTPMQQNFETVNSGRYFDNRESSTNSFSQYMDHDSNHSLRNSENLFDGVDSISFDQTSMESILSEAVQLEFEAFTSISQLHSSGRELNEVERAKLNELIVANKALNAPIDEDISSLLGSTPHFKDADNKADQTPLLTIINLTAVAIRRLIKMAKRINAFKNMCEEDQIALLKGGSLEMMVLRSTMSYDCDRNAWEIPHTQEGLSSIDTGVLKLAKGNIYQAYERFMRTFDPRWRSDENIILIMSAIVLFTVDRPKVVHSDVVKLERNSYYYLLRRYLESLYPGCEAKSTFLKLIQKIKELSRLANEVISVYLDVNPVEPLLMEIFDL